MFCAKCGAKVNDEDNFCESCGSKITITGAQVMSQNTLDVNQSETKRTKRKIGIVATGIAVIAILCVGGYFLLSKDKSETADTKSKAENQINKVKAEESPTAEPTEEPASDKDTKDLTNQLVKKSAVFTQKLEKEDIDSGINELLATCMQYTISQSKQNMKTAYLSDGALVDLAGYEFAKETWDDLSTMDEEGNIKKDDFLSALYSLSGRNVAESAEGKLCTFIEDTYKISGIDYDQIEEVSYEVESLSKNDDGEIRVTGMLDCNNEDIIPEYFEAVFIENSDSIFDEYSIKSLEISSAELEITGIDASSTLANDRSNTYGTGNLTDNNRSTAWVEGKEDDGVGETLTIHLNGEQQVSAIAIANGYQKSESLFEKNNSLSDIEVSFSDGSTQNYELDTDGMEITSEQRTPLYTILYLDEPVKTSEVKIKIEGTESGSDYNDTCISELKVLKYIIRGVSFDTPLII